MKSRFSFQTLFGVAILTSGLLVLALEMRVLDIRQPLLFVFMVLVALIRVAHVDLPQGDRFSLDASLVIVATLLFDVPSALAIGAGGIIIAEVGRDQKNGLSKVIYPVSQRSIIIYLSTLWLGGRYVTAPAGGQALNLLSIDMLWALALCLTFFIGELTLYQFSSSQRLEIPFAPALLGSLGLLGPIYFSLAANAILIAIMYPSMGLWAVFLFGLPLLVIHYSFELFLSVKNTYKHTIAALTKAIQVEDYQQRGHSERVADLSVDIGRELGFHGDRLESLGYAALLHDVGKLGMDIDSFDALLDSRRISDKIAPHAQIGAEILEQVEFLKKFADVVRKHHLPYTGGPAADIHHPVEARIVALANYFDQLTQTVITERRLSPNQAVARIKKEAMYFDPRVVRALINVLKRHRRLIVTSR